ncbi:MAG: ComEC/Rec2 family competence protein [Hydrococcus sp. Prado102]|nr:ComEC/Rec2 family competence protein [Hydrococcus sp. Prado102]
MNRNSWTVLCLAYAIALLSTNIFGITNPNPSWQTWFITVSGLGFLSVLAAIFIPRFWRRGPKWQLWLAAGLFAIFAVVYFQLRIPQPGSNDISNLFKEGNNKSQFVTVTGKILTQTRLTSSNRVQFWLEAQQLQTRENNRQVTGKLYVTIPPEKGANLYPSQQVEIRGILYQPSSPANPGSFDFRAYLASQGAFAGLRGLEIESMEEGTPAWGLWQLRQRIVNAQVRWMGKPEGLLLGSMVLGQRAVDLPSDIRDAFIKAGLAHILAASGFQVSLLLGVVIRLTGRFSARSQFILGLCTIGLYLGLTGLQASVARAAAMGVGALVALIAERKVRQLGSLLVAGTLLLLFNPLWIWDLGFQLSFLATFGLIVTMPALEKRLDWLPPAIATLISLPLAASVWTFPLLLHTFSVVATYSILANIVAAPLVSAISLAGMVSAGAALIYPPIGSAIAWLLYYPTHWLVQLVQFFTTLPGSSLAIGRLSLGWMLLIYLLMGLIWLHPWWQRRWWLVGLVIVSLIVIPIRYSQLNLLQVTIFATKKAPVLVIQERGKVALINSGDRNTAKYTIVPFLNRQGINRLDYTIAFSALSNQADGWSEIEKNLSIKHQLSSSDKTIAFDSTNIQLLDATPSILQLQIQGQTWLLLDKGSSEAINTNTLKKFEKRMQQKNLQKPNLEEDSKSKIQNPKSKMVLTGTVLLWSGKSLNEEWLDRIKPQVAIAISSTVSQKTQQQLQQRQIKLYWTGRDGAIQWNRDRGFQTTLDASEPDFF